MKWQKIYNSGLRWLWITILVFLFDRLSKQWIVNHFTLHEWYYCLSWLNIGHVQNPGGAFSLLAGHSSWHFIFIPAMLIICIIIIVNLAINHSSMIGINIAYNFILGGAWGNLYDRMCYQGVIDFIDLHIEDWHWPAFNLADSAICLGSLLLLVATYNYKEPAPQITSTPQLPPPKKSN